MRRALGIFVCGAFLTSLSVLAGCSADDGTSSPRRGNGDGSPNNSTNTNPKRDDPSTATTPAETACASVAPAIALSDIADAKDIHLAGKAAFFTSGSKVLRVTKDGKDKKEVFTSPNLTSSYVDSTAMILIEATPDNPDATTIRVIAAASVAAPAPGAPPPAAAGEFPEFPLGQDPAAAGITTATNFNAAGTRVFASDETSFFVLADTAAGDTIVRISKTDLGQATIVPATTNVITNPQVASNAVWYVRDQQRVFKVALPDDNTAQGEPTEVFGVSYTSVNLAVNDTNAFITVGNAVERRDLTGANPTKIFDAEKSATSARLGAAIINGGALFVRSEQPDAKVKHVIRSLKPNGSGTSDEKLVACGRELVTGFDADATSVVWAEAKGVFVAPR